MSEMMKGPPPQKAQVCVYLGVVHGGEGRRGPAAGLGLELPHEAVGEGLFVGERVRGRGTKEDEGSSSCLVVVIVEVVREAADDGLVGPVWVHGVNGGQDEAR